MIDESTRRARPHYATLQLATAESLGFSLFLAPIRLAQDRKTTLP